MFLYEIMVQDKVEWLLSRVYWQVVAAAEADFFLCTVFLRSIQWHWEAIDRQSNVFLFFFGPRDI